MTKELGASLVLMAGLALAAKAQDASQPLAGAGWDEMLPDDMQPSVSSADPYMPAPGAKLQVKIVLANWELTPRELANSLIKRYGPPDVVAPQALIWHHRGPWLQIVVREDGAPHNFPYQHSDWLEQTVAYRVPAARFADLAAFDGSLLADRTRGELTARSDSERANFLALNLADEIVGGKKTVDEARQRLAGLLNRSAGPSPYVQGLLFQKHAGAADPDRSADDSNSFTSP